MPGALEGIRVIDFGHYIAGPLTGMLLADYGADVIKVDPPGGPRCKTPANATWNRGKRSILLDVKQKDDLATAQALVRDADVVVENFRPGVAKRLGLGPDEMLQANPHLVYCSIPGFASDDPRAGVPAWEGVIGAAAATFLLEPRDDGVDEPVYSAIPTASTFGAFHAAVAIAMALNARQRNGLGQHIEVPLYDGMFATNAYRGISFHDPVEGPNFPYAAGSFGPTQYRGAWDGFYRCKDDRWLYFSGYTNLNWRHFLEAAGIADWQPETALDFDALNRDPELLAQTLKRAQALFMTRTAQEWEDLVAASGSEAVVCRTSQEWMDHPQARESKMVIQVDDPTYGKMLQPGINVRLSRTPGEVRGPAPLPDQHREEILSQLASPPPAGPLPSPEPTLRSALQGVRVVDLCIELAGPTLGRTLAEFGADVIRVDNPTRKERHFTMVLHNDVNQGKRSIFLDLKTEEGRNVLWKFLEGADVVIQSYRMGKLKKLGLGYDEIRKRNPNIIYASLNAYGHPGPWAQRPAHDPCAQSVTGMSLRFGGDGFPLLQASPTSDYGTGFMAAYGVALALLHRQRTGEGQYLDTALAYTTMTMQSLFMQSYEGKVWDEPRGRHALGDGPLQRCYQARDGWLFLGARETDLPSIAGVDGLSGVQDLRGQSLAKALEERFQARPVQAWVSLLNAAGIGAHSIVSDFAELMVDPWAKAHGLSLTRDHEGIGLVTTCGPAFRLSRTPVRPGRPAPRPGRNAREILEEHGMGEDYQRLVDVGAVATKSVNDP